MRVIFLIYFIIYLFIYLFSYKPACTRGIHLYTRVRKCGCAFVSGVGRVGKDLVHAQLCSVVI